MTFDKDIPIPPLPRPASYAFGKMQAGDSFFVPWDKKTEFTAAANYRKRHEGWKFTVRRVVEGGVKGVRVWCVERPSTIGRPARNGWDFPTLGGLPVRRVNLLERKNGLGASER